MTRRKRRATLPASTTDIGPAILHARGEVAVLDVADPDAPNRTIRRARRYDPLRAMHDLDTALFMAAERFRDRYELADGARDGSGNARLEPWQRCLYAAHVADARAEVRDSLQAVGLRLSAVFVGAVIQYRKLRHIERELNIRNGSAADLVRDALENLRDYQSGITP